MCLTLPLALASESLSHSFSLPFPRPLLLTMCFLLSALPCIGFPGGTVVKNSPASAGIIRDMGLIPGLGRLPGEGNGNPLQYSCLENPMDRGVWRATVHGVAKSWIRLRTQCTHTDLHWLDSLVLGLSVPQALLPWISLSLPLSPPLSV